jgi:hypothetical protein
MAMTNSRAGQAASEGDVETATYLVSKLEELAPLAQRDGLPVVAYLLEMALMEARTVAGHSPRPFDGSQ